MIGLTYSTDHYNEFKKTGNKAIFEQVVDKVVSDFLPNEVKEAIDKLPLSSKRTNILSFLDKDRSLFLSIKALMNHQDFSREDHIKDVIRMLREYVKVGEIEKDKFGEVMTPLELVKEMLATLPEEVWSNPNLKWLDPANGTGPYPAVVIYKLMKGLKEWEPNEKKRYKHIVENMIYVSELQPKNMFLWLCLVDPHDEYDCNVYTGSFLDKGFDNHIKEVWGVEKFDIVIGNPPYNGGTRKNLYIDFFEKSYKVVDKNGYLTFVTPSRFVIQPEYKDFRNYTQSISKIVNIKNTGRVFGDNASFSTVYTTIYFGGGCDVDWLSGYDNSIVRKVLGKVGNKLETIRAGALLKNKEERDKYNDIKKEDHNLFFVNAKGNCDSPFRYIPFKKDKTFVKKVYLTEFVGTGSKKTLGKVYIDKNGDVGLGTDSCMYIKCDNNERLESLKFFLSSKTIDYVINVICQSSHVNQTMKLIVDPTLYISIKNNIDIYGFFGFDEKEIKEIENY